MAQWYGDDVLEHVKKNPTDIQALATWWEERNREKGKPAPPHIRNRAMDVDPVGDRRDFLSKE